MIIRLRQANNEYAQPSNKSILRPNPPLMVFGNPGVYGSIIPSPQFAYKRFLCNIWKKRNERLNVEGVSIRSRNGAPSRKGRVVNGHMTKASNI